MVCLVQHVPPIHLIRRKVHLRVQFSLDEQSRIQVPVSPVSPLGMERTSRSELAPPGKSQPIHQRGNDELQDYERTPKSEVHYRTFPRRYSDRFPRFATGTRVLLDVRMPHVEDSENPGLFLYFFPSENPVSGKSIRLI